MKLIIGADHAGIVVKDKLKNFFDTKKIEYEDVGTNSKKSVDYPDYAVKVAKKVVASKSSENVKGILICGSGTGMVIAANKIKGIRAVAAYDVYTAKMSRAHNDANILALRGRFFPYAKTEKIVDVWLKTKFSGKERHKKRIAKLKRLDLRK